MKINNDVPLILGSSSPARKYLLEKEGYEFSICSPDIDEPTDAGYPNPRQLVQHISWLKAEVVAPQFEEGIIITADTVAWIDGEPIGKPRDEADARRILNLLGGRKHELWTGVCLWRRPDDAQLIWQERSWCFLQKLTGEELEKYLATREWANNSGGYAIKETEDPYVQVVEGSLSNVIGLPMESFRHFLSRLSSI